MKAALVTGGTGFLGSNLCERLLREGRRVICTDNDYTGCMGNVSELVGEGNFRSVHHDVCDPFDPGEHVDEIFNPACPACQGSHSIGTTRACELRALKMLGLAKAHGAREYIGGVRRVVGRGVGTDLVFSFTCVTHGEPQCAPIDERCPQAPINPHGQSKLMIEQISADHERAYEPGGNEAYPIPVAKNTALYERCTKFAAELSYTIFCGWLGCYRYFKMDQHVKNILDFHIVTNEKYD